MPFKIPSHVRKSWTPDQVPKSDSAIDQLLPTESFPGLMQFADAPLGDRFPFPSGFAEMLDATDYQVALVSKSARSGQQPSRVGSSAPPPSGVVLEFSWRELVSRVADYVRKSERIQQSRISRFSDVSIDFVKLEVTRGSGEAIPMTNQEFKMLHCFLLHPGRVFSRDELLDRAWGYDNYPVTRTVDNHVLKLRKKLEPDPANPVHFQTVHRIGYKFVP